MLLTAWPKPAVVYHPPMTSRKDLGDFGERVTAE